jgi:hypothetical protein
MDGKKWRLCLLVALLVAAAPRGTRAADVKQAEEEANKAIAQAVASAVDVGKAAEFKGQTLDLKAKDQSALVLTFPAGKKVSVSVKSDKKADVNLYVLDASRKEVAKDDSPGPDCLVTFTPKEAGKYTLVLVNRGPGETKSTVKVDLAK